MKLQSVQLQNFRCFEDITINFHERLTVLVGGNGSGKTAVLDAVNLFLPLLLGGYQEILGINAERKLDANSDAEIVCSFYNAQGEVKLNSKSLSIGYKSENPSEIENKSVLYYRNLHNTTPIYRDKIYSQASVQTLSYQATLKWFSDKEAQEAKHAKKIKNMEYNTPELQAVREAVSHVLGEYDFPYTDKVPVDMFITKKGNPDTIYSVSQLSDGYRTMLAFVIDLARMMAIANAEEYNKQGKSVLESSAIVLIDEVDLHLHPSWQQRVLPDLMRTFPNTQFIVTTHSPQVISSIANEHIRILNDGKVYEAKYETLGASSARVLGDIFDVDSRPNTVFVDDEEPAYPLKTNIAKYFSYIDNKEYNTTEAKALRAKLDEILVDDPMLRSADAEIERAERLAAWSKDNA